MAPDMEVLEASTERKKKHRTKKKRREPEPDVAIDQEENTNGIQIDDNEPTIAEKLASMDLLNKESTETQDMQESSPVKLPSADSVHVLLKQALHADDRALLLDCLYNQNERVITNSISLLSPADIFKLLDSLISVIQTRGAVVVCALPWLRSLLLQHSSRIISQEHSLVALNSLYQLIEARVSNLSSALQLASYLDLYAGADGADEVDVVAPVIYVDDESEEEESDDAMETDKDGEELEHSSGVSDS